MAIAQAQNISGYSTSNNTMSVNIAFNESVSVDTLEIAAQNTGGHPFDVILSSEAKAERTIRTDGPGVYPIDPPLSAVDIGSDGVHVVNATIAPRGGYSYIVGSLTLTATGDED